MNQLRRSVAAALILLLPLPCLAHELQLSARSEGDTIVVEARYPGGIPLESGRYVVTEPGGVVVVHQEGQTDAAGRLRFVPTRPGNWSVVVEDGIGHRAHLTVPVGRDEDAGETAAAPTSGASDPQERFLRWLAGLVLIALVFALVAWLRRRRAPAAP